MHTILGCPSAFEYADRPWPASGAVAHERPDSNRLCGERRPLMLEQGLESYYADHRADHQPALCCSGDSERVWAGRHQSSLFLSPANSGKLIWGVGSTMTFPTASASALGSGRSDLRRWMLRSAMMIQPNSARSSVMKMRRRRSSCSETTTCATNLASFWQCWTTASARALAAKHRVLEIGRAARTFTQAGQEQLKQSYKKLIGLTQKVRAQAAAVLVALKDHQLVARPEAFAQTRHPDKILSLLEPHGVVIRNGKAHKPNEFGRLVRIDEVENGLVSNRKKKKGSASLGNNT
jgi:hypothetical protein